MVWKASVHRPKEGGVEGELGTGQGTAGRATGRHHGHDQEVELQIRQKNGYISDRKQNPGTDLIVKKS